MYLQPDTHPHKTFVENKHQSAIRKACQKAVEVPFFCFFGPESRIFPVPSHDAPFRPTSMESTCVARSQFSSAERSGRGSQPKNAKTRPKAGYSKSKNRGPQSLPRACRMGALACDAFALVAQALLPVSFSWIAGALACDLSNPAMLVWHSRPRLWPFTRTLLSGATNKRRIYFSTFSRDRNKKICDPLPEVFMRYLLYARKSNPRKSSRHRDLES